MAIYLTPYDTTAGLGYRYAHIVQEVKTALTAGALAVYDAYDGLSVAQGHSMPHGSGYKPHKLALVQGASSFADAVHFFKHPVTFSEAGQDYVCIDVREFGKWDAMQQQFAVRNFTEFVWSVKRALLTDQWATGQVQMIRDLSNIPAQVYSALISESIARRFALDAAEQAVVAILAAYFYYGLFNAQDDVSEDDKNFLAGKIARVTHLDASMVFSYIDSLDAMRDVAALCDAIRKHVGNVALENLNVGTLFNVVGGTWWGHNARETLCMGLEHMPTWTMIVAASLSSATYKRSTLAKISTRFDKRAAGDQFAQALAALLGGHEAVPELSAYKDFFGAA